MNRKEFMEQLEQLLTDIPQEEKEEAIAFYSNYFDDAGEENEQQVMKELQSPERIASIIKSDLSEQGEYSKNGEYTEHGYRDANEGSESIMMVKPSAKEEQTAEGEASQTANNNAGYNNSSYNQNNGYQGNSGYQGNNGGFQNQGYQGNADFQKQNGYVVTKSSNIPLLIILCVLTFPIILPITISLFATVFGLVVGFGAAAVACTVAGFSVAVAGIVKVFVVPSFGMAAIGGGLICLGIGLLFFVLTSLIAKAFPALCKGLVAIYKAPFAERRVSA